MPPYMPIEPFEVLSARIGRDASQIIKLDANENPYGPLPAVRQALGNLEFPHIYPDPESRALRASLEKFTGVPAEYLLAGAGADELIDLLM
ncbi:MAG: histidinol-phosphate aminotransferase, partial [Nitrospirales bacterium]